LEEENRAAVRCLFALGEQDWLYATILLAASPFCLKEVSRPKEACCKEHKNPNPVPFECLILDISGTPIKITQTNNKRI
jgi:hypothetical protein